MLKTIGGIPLVEFIYKRCILSNVSNLVSVITSDEESDDELFEYCNRHNIEAFRGSLNNVLHRYVKAAEFYNSSVICRVCGDSPFVDTQLIDEMFQLCEREQLDYVAPDKRKCIAGLDSEVITLSALKKSMANYTSDNEIEHVTVYIRNKPKDFRIKFVDADLKPNNLKDFVLTVDYPDDLLLCNKIIDFTGNNFNFSSKDILLAMSENRRFLNSNQILREIK